MSRGSEPPSVLRRGQRPERWLGDALRAVRALGVTDPDEARAVCALILGPSAPPRVVRDAPPPPPSPEVASPVGDAGPRRAGGKNVEQSPRDRLDVPSQIVEISERSAAAQPDLGPRGSPATLERDPGVEWRKAPGTLFRARVERSIVREIAAADLPSARIDVERLVESVVKIELPIEIPYLSESTTRRGVQLLLDRGARLTGFVSDVERLEERFASLLNRGNVETLWFREFPGVAGAGSSDTWTAYRSPPPFVPVVVVTAFARSNERAWVGLVKRWSREQREVTFLVPHGPERAPPGVAAAARVVPWDAPTTARSVRRQRLARRAAEPAAAQGEDPLARLERRSPEAAKLARYASLAAYVDPALLRALRDQLLPRGATPAAELDLWTSDVTASRTRDGFVFASPVLDRLRREVATDERRADALAIVQRVHDRAPPLLRLEERLVALSLRPAGTLDEASVRAELEPVVAAMEQFPERTKNLAHWFARTVARLPAVVVRSDLGRLLAFVTTSYVKGAAAPEELPSEAALRRAAALVPAGQEALIALRWLGPEETRVLEILRVSDRARLDDRWHVIRVASSEPLVVWVCDEPMVIGAEPLRVDVSEATRGAAARSTPIRDLAGKRWGIVPRDDRSYAIAVARTQHMQAIAYLVDADLCFTASHAFDTDELELTFSWGTVRGKVIARGGDTSNWALIRLDPPATAAPFPLGPDMDLGDAWEITLSASQRLRGRGARRVTHQGTTWLVLDLLKPDLTILRGTLGAPVLVGGRVVGHITFPDLDALGATADHVAFESLAGVVCPSSVLRRGWAEAKATTVPGLAERLVTVEPFVPGLTGGTGTGIAVGRRTFLTEPTGRGDARITPRREALRAGRVYAFGSGRGALAVSIAPGSTDDFSLDLWRGHGASPYDPAPAARAAHVAVDYVSDVEGALTFVCVADDVEGFQLQPCPVDARSTEAPGIVALDERSTEGGDKGRILTGLPVFEKGRLVGLTRPRETPTILPLYTIADLVRDIAPELLEPRDWARLGRRIHGDPSQGGLGLPRAATGPEPSALLDTLLRTARSRPLLQFALDQSVRRLEAREPSRVPEPRLRAELVLGDFGRPRSELGDGRVRWEVQLSLAGVDPKNGFYTDAIYNLGGETRTADDPSRSGTFSIPLGVYEDLEVGIEVFGSPEITLRAQLCDLLDEEYLSDVKGDVEAIEDAIDELRRH